MARKDALFTQLLAPLLIITPQYVGVSDTFPCWGAGLNFSIWKYPNKSA